MPTAYKIYAQPLMAKPIMARKVVPTENPDDSPYAEPSQEYNFLKSVLPSGLTYTNSSTTRYYEAASGTYTTAAANAAIFEYRSGVLQGMRWEMEQRTNLALWNRDLTNAAWTKTNGTAAKDQAGIDAVSNSASSFTATAGNATCLQSITSASAARVTSFFLKRITGTGTVNITQDNGTTWTAVTLTSAWQRFQVTATAADPIIGIRIVTSGDAVALDFAQHETPASTASSPIATTTASVIRQPDVLAASSISWYRQDEGTVLFEGIVSAITASTGAIYVFSDGTNNERMSTYLAAGSGFYYSFGLDGGATQYGFSATTAISAGSIFRHAFVYKANAFALTVNGGAPVTDTSGTLPTITYLKFGSSSATAALHFMGYARRFQYFNTRLPNGQIQGMSRV